MRNVAYTIVLLLTIGNDFQAPSMYLGACHHDGATNMPCVDIIAMMPPLFAGHVLLRSSQDAQPASAVMPAEFSRKRRLSIGFTGPFDLLSFALLISSSGCH